MSVRLGRAVGAVLATAGLALGLGALGPAQAQDTTAFGSSAGTTNWTQLAGWFSAPKYPPDERYRPSATSGSSGGFSFDTPATQAAAASSDSGRSSWIDTPQNAGLGGFLSEIRGGVALHDSGPVSSSTEDGYNVNLEVLFTSPEIFKYILSPRPHLGGSINTEGDTSQGYFGLSWTADIYEHFFLEFSFGGSVHDGNLEETPKRNGLGCRLLFRESISAGVIFDGHHNLSLMYDHISNAGFCDDNDGLDTLGIRYGYRF